MKVLDCETLESAYESFQNSFGVDEMSLRIRFDEIASALPHLEDVPDEELLGPFLSGINCYKPFDVTYWFHLTRLPASISFDSGILPLVKVIDSLWDLLFDLAEGQLSKEQWNQVEQSMAGEFLYQTRTRDPNHMGPHAFLIKPMLIDDYNKNRTFSHYWDAPEMVEDICRRCQEMFGIDLLSRFQGVSSARTIKFRVHESQLNHLLAALRFLYSVHHQLPYFQFLNPIYSGEVRPDQIVTPAGQ